MCSAARISDFLNSPVELAGLRFRDHAAFVYTSMLDPISSTLRVGDGVLSLGARV